MAADIIHEGFGAEARRSPRALTWSLRPATTGRITGSPRPRTRTGSGRRSAGRQVTQDLLLPAAAAQRLRAETGWDQVSLIARLTGRSPVTPAETALIESAHVGRLALG